MTTAAAPGTVYILIASRHQIINVSFYSSGNRGMGLTRKEDEEFVVRQILMCGLRGRHMTIYTYNKVAH